MSRPLASWMTYAAYPLVIGGGIGIHTGLMAAQVPLLWSTNISVVLGMLAVSWLEARIPYELDWKAVWGDVRNDLLFLVVVQALLPKVLTFLAAVTLVYWREASGLEVVALWPGHLPIGLQVVLMVLGADLLRYGFHVLCHNNSLLWRLHAVHHSPKKLYWLNVGRFHPVEKALQFLLDALPFIVLGVGPRVLGFYFVFYALNGFLQHSNVDVRLGFLNYLISGPELHRWHHSRLAEESNANYGNNVIVWDILFKTRFLPKERTVGELGLQRGDYPQSFLAQMTIPGPYDVEENG